jgi:hypothetical protein
MRQLTEVTKYLVQTTGRHGYKQEKIFFVVDHGSLGKFDTNHAGAVSLKIIVGYALQGDVGIVHQCNCYHAVETILWIHPLNYASFVPPSSGAVDILVYLPLIFWSIVLQKRSIVLYSAVVPVQNISKYCYAYARGNVFCARVHELIKIIKKFKKIIHIFYPTLICV